MEAQCCVHGYLYDAKCVQEVHTAYLQSDQSRGGLHRRAPTVWHWTRMHAPGSCI